MCCLGHELVLRVSRKTWNLGSLGFDFIQVNLRCFSLGKFVQLDSFKKFEFFPVDLPWRQNNGSLISEFLAKPLSLLFMFLMKVGVAVQTVGHAVIAAPSDLWDAKPASADYWYKKKG